MAVIANTVIIPTRATALYEEPGIDLIVAETDSNEWHHIEWIPANDPNAAADDGVFEWDWNAQLHAAGWIAYEGDIEQLDDSLGYFTVPVARR